MYFFFPSKNFVIAVSAEGWFHLFDLSAKPEGPLDPLQGDEQKATYTQHLPANTKLALISDIDGDGLCELLLGYTDRVVRAFCWESPPDADLTCGQLVALKKWLLEGQVKLSGGTRGGDADPFLHKLVSAC
uniref:Integrin alpha FG-GAP repeat containing 2 n=1 Tax=Xenopus tropicalis TaxID=8364 RepID=A0A6I8T2K8_XENTR